MMRRKNFDAQELAMKEELKELFLEMSPENSEPIADLQARSIIEDLNWSDHLFRASKSDKSNAQRVENALSKISKLLEDLTNNSKDNLEDRLHDEYLYSTRRYIRGEEPRIPLSIEELDLAIDFWLRALTKFHYHHDLSRPSHGTNPKAIFLIQETRKAYRTYAGRVPPLNYRRGSDYGRFLSRVFEIFNIHCDLKNIHDRWREHASDPNMSLDPPVGPGDLEK